MVWINLNIGEAAAVQEIDTLSDRAAAIVGATILESRLEERVKSKLLDFSPNTGKSLSARMFRNDGPLGSFSSRINLGFMIGLYDELSWRDLDLIRSIRNDFAHQTSIGSFEWQSVTDRCANLKACDLYFKESQTEGAQVPIANFSGPRIDTLPHIFFDPDIARKRQIPRQRYLLCIMYYAMVLKLPLVLQSLSPHKTPPADV